MSPEISPCLIRQIENPLILWYLPGEEALFFFCIPGVMPQSVDQERHIIHRNKREIPDAYCLDDPFNIIDVLFDEFR